MMPPPLPAIPSKDAEHLKLLSVFHYVFAGLSVLGLGFLVLHFMFMRMIFTNPAMLEGSKGGPPPQEICGVFIVFYAIGGVLVVVAGILNFLSAKFMRQRRHRMFSLVVAGMNCLQVPIGTVLGIFTILVLCRDSVLEMYGDGLGERREQ